MVFGVDLCQWACTLQEALREYKGTVIIASHDLYFLRQIMNRVVEAADYRLRDYSGDCNYYLEHNLEARQIELEWAEELGLNGPAVKSKSKMSKAEKELQKKQKAKAFSQSKNNGKVTKNAKRWNWRSSFNWLLQSDGRKQQFMSGEKKTGWRLCCKPFDYAQHFC